MYHLLIEKLDPFGFGEDSLSCETRGRNNWELEHPVCAVDSEADEERINEAVSFDMTKQIRCTKVRVRKKMRNGRSDYLAIYLRTSDCCV